MTLYQSILITETRSARARADWLLTLYNAILRIARNLLETKENIKILTDPFYPVNWTDFHGDEAKKIKMADTKLGLAG